MKCSAIAVSGQRCKSIAITGSDYCHGHHPDRAEARRIAARKGGKRGGRGRPAVEVHELRGQLEDLYSSVLTGMIEPKVGAVLSQIANSRIRLIEADLKAREQLELETRLETLEAQLEEKDQVSAWR